MTCAGCGHQNRPGARFCEECAAPLQRRCAGCGSELRPTAKFCDECGAPASGARSEPKESGAHRADPTPITDTRKIVTIVFADLVGSTALHERLDPESARRFMESYYSAMRGVVEAQGGTVTQLLGDGVKAVFGIPRVAEDDAIRAVHAAAAMQEAFRALADQQHGAVGKTGLRVAVNTGEVVARDESEIIGDPVNVAARLQEQGQDGDVVVGESTHRLVSTLVTVELLGSFALKGRSEAVKAYRVISLERPAGAATAPFVGRDEELTRLAAVYETAVEKPAAGLAVLLGSPGLGKSRLIDEFARRHADATTVVQANCDAAGGATFAPLAEALRELLGIEGDASAESLHTAIEDAIGAEHADRTRIASGITALLSGSPASPEETFFVVRRLLGALAQTKPVVLVIDDLHWAEPLLLDLVEHLIQWGSGVPLFVLIGARPELRDLRSSLVTPGGLVSDVVTLHGLDAGAAMRLAANVIGAADLPAAIAAKVLATSEGNPLFVGELVRMLVQEGALTKEGDRWVAGANLAALEMPPTIHALLAARIERLRPEERTVLERAAVVGRQFSRSAVAALLPREAGDLDARLEALRRSELIERDTGWLLGEPVLRFHHVLIRDAAYRRLLKGTRAELHATLADWVEAQVGDAPEHDETIGRHLEQAHQFLRDLGPLEEDGKRLGARAAQRLAAAGRRALARDDLPVAADLLGRAIERLDGDDPARADLALDWCEALLAAGDVAPASAAIDELGRLSAGSDRLHAWHTCFAGQHQVLTAPSELHATAEAVAAAAAALTAQGDANGEAKAHFVHALALSRLGQVGACEAALDRALAAARRAGDRRRANTVLAIAPLAALWGPSPVTRASGRCLDVVRVLRITQGAPAVEAVALSCQGVLEALRGRGEAARRMIASARKMVEELGITQRLLEADVFGGLVEQLEGDAPAAERSLRCAYEGLRDLGLGIDAARAAALLARALLAQDRVAEAEALSHESEALAGDDLKAAIAWRGVRAEALAKRGEHAAAVEFASKAVELAAATDALLDHADARLALAAALRAASRGPEAAAEEARAKELWQAKGATLLAERTVHTAAPVAAAVAAAGLRAAHAPRRRPVRPNFAFEEMRRAEAAVAARDARALEALYRRDVEIVDHQFGVTYGHDAIVERVRAIIEESTESAFAHEPLASLGDSLALCRMRSTASGSTVHGISIGATEAPYLLLIEADEQGSARHIEIFGDAKLGDAVVRLYERYAELLPEGPERARSAMTARSVAAVGWSSGDPEPRLAAMLAPDFVGIDHRPLSNWSLQGATAYLEHLRALQQVADDIEFRQVDVVALGPNAQLLRVLHTGTGRASGGAYERPLLSLFATDAEGRLARAEWFDDDREAEALARFDALTAEAAEPRSFRRVRPNSGTRTGTLFAAAMASHDLDALARILSAQLEVVHHPTGSTYGSAELLESFRSTFEADRVDHRWELMAGLGERLSLARSLFTVEGVHAVDFAMGLAEVEIIHLFEVDEVGLLCRSEVFAGGRLGDAVARCYERYGEQLPAGAARVCAEATARSVAVVAPGGFDRERYAAAFRPDVEIVDHRLLGSGSYIGSDALFRSLATWTEVSDQVASRPQDVLALTDDALLLRWLASGVGRESGGPFEWAFLRLFVFDADGRVARYELFDDDREAEALACYDALAGRKPENAAEPFANAASRLVARGMHELWAARDWDGIVAMISPAIRMDDRRRIVRLEIGYEAFVAQFRMLFDQPGSRWREQLVATRGERLALTRTCFEAEVADGGGPLAFEEHWSLSEMDAEGRLSAFVTFDLEDEDAAYAELDARFAADPSQARGRTTVAFDRAIARRDWEAVAALCSPAFAEHDHRSLAVLGTTRGGEAWMQNFRALVELAPDTIYRTLHARGAARGFLSVGAWLGSREGGRYEIPLLAVCEVDARGAIARADLYEPDQQGQALARFAELRTIGAENAVFENAASRANRALGEASNARDFARIEALLSPSLVFDDRRRLNRLKVGREEALAHYRFLQEVPLGRFSSTLMATRGERLALHRTHFEGEVAGGGGAVEVEGVLDLAEIDAEGRVVANLLFDLADEDAAYAELDARFEAGEGAADPYALASRVATDAAIRTRHWEALVGQFAPTFRMRDHRLLGWGTMVNDAATFVRVIRSAVELAPDSSYRNDHLRICARGTLSHVALVGTRDGGAFENRFLRVDEVDEQGRVLSSDLYDESDFERAFARFAELAAPAAAEGRFENAASRAWRAVNDAWVARDLERFAAPHAAALRYRDHRRLFQLDLDRTGFLDFTRPLIEMRAGRASLELVATRGERLALMHSTMEMADDAIGPSVIESLMGIETDGRGDIATYDRWDLEDEDAAWAEIEARWNADEGAQGFDLWAARFGAALERRDWDAVAAGYAPDFVGHDHRLVSWGTVHGPSALVRALQEMVALAPDARMRMNHRLACARGALLDNTWVGTRDGGAFESPFVCVAEFGADGRTVRSDFYDPHHLDRALARFEEIRVSERRDPLAAIGKPNAASAAMDRWQATYDVAFDTGDWEPMRALCTPDLVFDDRRRLALLSGDRDFMIASARERVAMDARPQRRLVGTAGDRVVVETLLWSGGPSDGRFEIEYLGVIEVDESGLVTGMVMFDIDDARAAQREAWARWAAIDPLVAPWVELLSEIVDAWNAHDRARLRASMADDVVIEDHRHTGIGRIEGAASYVDANAVLWDLAPDQRVEFGWSWLAWDRHGLVATLRRSGTLADGGAFESEYVWLSLASGGRITRLELFEIEALDAALARFEELRPDPLRIPPNAATRSLAPIAGLLAKGDLDVLRALVTDDFCFDDRTRRSLLRGGVEEWVRALQFMSAETRAQINARLVATAGERLALYHDVWREAPGESRFRMESHRLVESDAAGRLRALVLFDADDRAAAHEELFERWVALGADGTPACLIDFMRAHDARDLDRMRAVLADDFVYHDHRRAGAGRIDGPDAYLASPRAWWELSEAVRIDRLYTVSVAPHGRLSVNRLAGRNREGGDFESFRLAIVWTRGERVAGVEMFDVDQLDAALARFEELRPRKRSAQRAEGERSPSGSLLLPQTAATRMRDRHRDAFGARDWDAIRALAGADFVFDDRGKRALVRGDVETWLASMEFTRQSGIRSGSTLLGTLGDRIVLDHLRWFGKPDGDAFEFERVRLLEVGEDGLLRAVVFFDPEDRVAASLEGLARFAAGEAAGSAGIAPLVALFRALCDRSWEAVRDCFAPDLIFVDHRPLGLGTLDREEWIASMQAGDELGDAVVVEVFRVLAWSEQGHVVAVRRFGTIADGGGPFEVDAILTALVVDGRIQRGEAYGAADAERAVARFEEWCAVRS